MLVRGFTHRRTIVMATAGIAMLAPAATASAGLPAPSITAPATSLLPAAPTVAAPPIAAIAASCPGARRARGTGVRRAAIACLVNRARGAVGLRGFRGSRALSKAATSHAYDMARRHFFAHQRAGGPSLVQRAHRAGWHGRSVGEAIAYGCGSRGTAASIVAAWLNSPPHRAILLSRSLGRAGIGVAARPPIACGGRGGTFVLDAAG
jgi:uncharacterized protein YkwD